MDFRIRGLIELDSQVERGVRSAIGSLDELSDVVLNQWWGLRNIADAFAAIGGAVAAGVGTAITEAVRWEDAMAEVERTTRSLADYDWESDLRLEGIEQDLRGIARTTPIAAGALAEIASSAGALGIATSDVGAFTKVVADLAAVTDLTEEQTATLFARVSSLTGLPAEQYENLASSILEVGRSTAATEQQLETYATRLAAFLAPVGFTADEIIGLSGAMASLGIASERGSTAIQKTFFDMQTAVSEGGQELQDFAQIAGVSIEEFTQLLAQDPSELLTRFVEGLDNVKRSGVDVGQVLSRLGIIEVRQVSTLQALAQAAQNTTAPATQLRNVFETSSDAFRENGALAQVTAAYYDTLSKQFQITRNKLDELQAILGEVLLPVLGAINTVLGTFLDGMLALPAPVRNAFAAVVVLGGALAAMTAAVFYIIPRLVLMRLSFSTLRDVALQTAGGLDAAGAAGTRAAGGIAAAGAAAGRTTGQMGAMNASGLASSGALTAAAGGASKLTGFLTKMGKALGIIGIVLTVASIAITAFGATVKETEDDVNQLGIADLALTNILQGQSGAIRENVDQWIRDQLIMSGAANIAARLGIDIATLTALITGIGATQGTWDTFAAAVDNAGDEGRQLLEIVRQLRLTFRASEEAAIATASAVDVAAGSYDNLTQDAQDAEKALKDATTAQEKRNQGLLAYGDAVLAARSAQFQYNDALEEYNQVVSDVEDPSGRIGDAEFAITEARWGVEEATEAVADAEENLKSARRDQLEDLADLELDLADARYELEEALVSVTEKEEELDKLRGGASVDELRKATLRLEKAQVGLLRSNQSLADAQWYLNYLRAEGAGDRDIAEAELALAEAQLGVRESEDELIDSQGELNDLRNGANPEELAQAERELARAIRDAERAERDILSVEKELTELRKDIANDTAYKDAQRDLLSQQRDLIDAERDLIKAERDLQKIMDGGIYDEVARAQLRLEEATYQLAKANTEVTKQTAIANGEMFSAGHEAQELARQLELIGADAPAAIRKNMSDISSVLRLAIPTFAEDIASGLANSGIGGGGGLGELIGDELFGDFTDELNEAYEETLPEQQSFWQGLKQGFDDNAYSILIGLGAAIGSAFPVVGTAIGAAIGAVIAFVYKGFTDGWWNAISDIFTFVNDTWNTLNGLGEDFNRVVRGWFSDLYGIAEDVGEDINTAVRGWFSEAAGTITEKGKEIVKSLTDWVDEFIDKLNISDDIHQKVLGWWTKVVNIFSEGRIFSASSGGEYANTFSTGFTDKIGDFKTIVANKARDTFGSIVGAISSVLGFAGSTSNYAKNLASNFATSFGNGISEKAQSLYNTASSIAGSVANSFGGFYETLKTKGSSMITGVFNGIQEKYNELKGRFQGIGTAIANWVGDFYEDMKVKGRNIIVGLYNGVVEKINELIGRFGAIGQRIADAIGDFFNFGSPSKKMKQWGSWIVEGLAKGVDGEARSLERSVEDLFSTFERPDPDALAFDQIVSRLEQADYSKMISAFDQVVERIENPNMKNLARQFEISGAMSSALLPASANSSQQAPVTNITNEGDNINVTARTDANPHEIARDIMWEKLVRTRR